ncbi:uncharacterized protein N7503_001954 [Penicillium pulvis]|uniref:uncharacterized protein n=1 Tax=Penicillium pulvis TaxID=1562058 RepID=UPI0025485C7C|nr:uncharacterized protein N7503_001954 [Penicillium pulvis]KAJ5809736.1 hypothetical protein N7503_001954 [Penicillium pulvis]
MGQGNPDERLVYLACQHIFRGDASNVRKLKVIKGLIREDGKPSLADILRQYNIKKISTVAKKLLEEEIFGNNSNAKMRFPDLFHVSPTQSAKRQISEAEAAQGEASAVKEIPEREVKHVVIVPQPKPKDEANREPDKSHLERNRNINKAIPSLYPVYVQYRCQHLITTTIQELVEESCFEFAQQHFPHVLELNNWDCPELVELTEWTKLLPQHSLHPAGATKKPMDEVFGLLRDLRHSAVHRLRKTATGIERLAENAQLFLETLEDVFRSEKVSVLRRELKSAVEELRRNKDLLEGNLRTQLEEIHKKRAELDACEKDAIESMGHEDLRCQNDIGKGLESIVLRVKSNEKQDWKGKGKLSYMDPDLYGSEKGFLAANLTTYSPEF